MRAHTHTRLLCVAHTCVHARPPSPCSRKLEAGGFVISQHALQHFIFEREKIGQSGVIYDGVMSESRRRSDSSYPKFTFDRYSYRSCVGLSGISGFLSHLRGPVPALAQIPARVVHDNRTDPSGSISLLSCLHLLFSSQFFSLNRVDLQSRAVSSLYTEKGRVSLTIFPLWV